MEKVTAYKSFDGKLFLTEEKCLSYEKEKKKYPLIKNKVYCIEGNLGLKKIEKRKYSSKNNFTTIENYYLLPNGWKINTTQRIEIADKQQIVGTLCFNLTLFIIQVLNENKTLTYNKLCEYLKYFYNSKKISGYTQPLNNYGLGEPIYNLEIWEKSIEKDLPYYLKIELKEQGYNINDTYNHIYIKFSPNYLEN